VRLSPWVARRLAALDPIDADRIVRGAEQAKHPKRYVRTAIRRAEVTQWRREQAARRQWLSRVVAAMRTAERELGYELAEAECHARLEELRFVPRATPADVAGVRAAMLRVFDNASDDELHRAVGGRSRAQRDQWVRRGVCILETGCTISGSRRLNAPDPRTARWLRTRAHARRRSGRSADDRSQ